MKRNEYLKELYPPLSRKIDLDDEGILIDSSDDEDEVLFAPEPNEDSETENIIYYPSKYFFIFRL